MKRFEIRKLDAYIFKKFISTFFVALLLIIGIVIIFDISEKINYFVENKAPLNAIIFDYYLNFIPYFINMFSPLFVFLTVIFFTSMMASNSEIIAMLSGGVSYRRIMVPYLAAAALIAVLSLGLNLYVIPKANVERLSFEAKYIKRHNDYKHSDIHYQIAPGQFVYVKYYSGWNKTAYDITIESVEDNKLVSKLHAESAAWDSLSGKWRMREYYIRNFISEMDDNIISGPEIDTVIALTEEDFYRNDKTVERLDVNELNRLIETQKMRGDPNVIYAQIEKQTRYALPFSAFILTIIGMTLSSRKKRGGIGWNIAIGIALSFSYILFLRFSQMFVYAGTLPPAVALWIPNVLFAFVAAGLYHHASR